MSRVVCGFLVLLVRCLCSGVRVAKDSMCLHVHPVGYLWESPSFLFILWLFLFRCLVVLLLCNINDGKKQQTASLIGLSLSLPSRPNRVWNAKLLHLSAQDGVVSDSSTVWFRTAPTLWRSPRCPPTHIAKKQSSVPLSNTLRAYVCSVLCVGFCFCWCDARVLV